MAKDEGSTTSKVKATMQKKAKKAATKQAPVPDGVLRRRQAQLNGFDKTGRADRSCGVEVRKG
jgi:hypothetical protein